VFKAKAKAFKAKDLQKKQGLGTKATAKVKDFVIKAKAKTKVTALCPRGASRTRPSP